MNPLNKNGGVFSYSLMVMVVVLLMIGEVSAQISGADNFNINSSSIAQRRAGNASDPNNFARNNPGFDPCLSPTGIQSGAKCDGNTNPVNGAIPLLSARNVGGATNDDNNRQGGFFHATSFGAVTDNMFGAVSSIVNCGKDGICGGVNAADDNDLTFCGDPAVDTGVTTGQNCGNLRYNPARQQMKIPEGSNNFHSVNFPLRRFFSLEVVSEDKDLDGDGVADYDKWGSPSGSPIIKTPDRTSFCGYTSPTVSQYGVAVPNDPNLKTPCQGPLVFAGIGTGFSSDFTFRRAPSAGTFNCGKDPRLATVQTTTDLTCSVMGIIVETQLETGFPDQHTEMGAYFHLTNPDCVGSSTGVGGNNDCAAANVRPGSGNLLALTESHTPAAYRGGGDPIPPTITVNWAQHITDPDIAGAIDPNQPAAFTSTMAGSFQICNRNVWTTCNQTFPSVNAPTGESQTRGDPNFFIGTDAN